MKRQDDIIYYIRKDIMLRVYTMTKKERSGVAKYHASPKESLELHNMGKKERILRGEESG
jgi:hypothetical protein